VDVSFGSDFKGGRLLTRLANPSEAEIGGMTDVNVPKGTREITLKLWIKGINKSSSYGANSLVFDLLENSESQSYFRGEQGGQSAGKESTSVHVKSIEWKEIDNDVTPLDENPNPGSGKRIYADKKEPGSNDNYNKVKVVVTLDPATGSTSGIKIALRAFDVDDPSSNQAPIDAESGSDNRGEVTGSDGKSHKEGIFVNSKLPTNVVLCNSEGIAEEIFQLTTQPGDNFRIGATLARDKVMKLDKWTAKQPDLEPATKRCVSKSTERRRQDNSKRRDGGLSIAYCLASTVG